MYLPEKQNFRFADVEVDTLQGCLYCGGEERHLRKKSFQVLIYLLERPGRLVSKNELFESVWQNTAVTDDVLVQCMTEIRRVIGDDPQRPKFIKTIPKTGYRFIGNLDVNQLVYTEEITRVEFEIEEETEAGDEHTSSLIKGSSQPWSALRRMNRFSIAASLSLVCLFGGAFYTGWPSGSETAKVVLPGIDGRKSVAVMFFENRSGSPEFEWLCEGLADMLNTGLSRSDKLNVLDRGRLQDLLERTGSAAHQITMDHAMDIARQSKSGILVTGSFAHIGDSIRVDVQIHDSRTGEIQKSESLTVEKAERLLTEIDLLSLKISNYLSAPPNDKGDMASVMTNNLEAYRYYSLAVEKAQALQSQDAIDLLEKAIALDPEFAMAHARVGYTYSVTWAQTEKGKPYLEKAFQLSHRLTEKDRMNIAAWYAIAHMDFSGAITAYRGIIARFPLETEAYWRLSKLLAGEEKYEEAIEAVRLGLAVDGGSKDLYNSLGGILGAQGKLNDAIAAHERYVALAPTEPNAYDSLGLSYQRSGNYPEAIKNYELALVLDAKFSVATIHLANSKLQLGKYREAIALYNRYIDNAPSKTEEVRGLDALAFVYLQLGKFEQAEEMATRARQFDTPLIWHSYLVALKQGETRQARRWESAMLSGMQFYDRGNRSNYRLELYYRGMLALNNDDPGKALDYFRQTLTHPPPTWHYTDFEGCLAGAFLKLGRNDEAISEYQRILGLNPHYPLAYFYLANAYERAGDLQNAKQHYRLFLHEWEQADDDIPEVKAARAFIASSN
jgi:eukaryotic-like serine/threonine-protein kinase